MREGRTLAQAIDRGFQSAFGTIFDSKTSLFWQQSPAGKMNWQSALKYCEQLILGGKNSDWRLPNIKELFSIVDFTKSMYNKYKGLPEDTSELALTYNNRAAKKLLESIVKTQEGK